jgi:hypothetical protein
MMLRRRNHSRPAVLVGRLSHPGLTALAFVIVCASAFLIGRGGI